MMKILLWGTGKNAELLWIQCPTLFQYELLGFVDNNPEKQGKRFHGLPIYSLEVLDMCKPDCIVVLAEAFDEIYQQIVNSHPEMADIIKNKNYFYQESLLKRYKNTTDLEKIEIIKYIKKNGLNIFNYSFSKKYKDIIVKAFFDTKNQMFYVYHYGKKLYFSKELNSEKKVVDYYKFILMEQDEHSPHRYLTDDFNVSRGDVVIDVGAAEGNFSLQIIDMVSKLYIIEVDEAWVRALEQTFRNYMDKVIIIKKFAFSYDDGDFVALDSLFHEPIDFIKMDIEGNEWDALQGARQIIANSPNLRCVVCSYHSDFDQILIEDFMDKNNLEHSTSPGYIWFPSTIRQNYVSTRLNKAIVRGIKNRN